MIKKAEKVYFLGSDLRNEDNLNLFDISLFNEKEVVGTVVSLEEGEIKQVKAF